MARIIVIPENADQSPKPVLLDERVDFVNLSEDHSAEALIERLGWALTDAEEAERAA